MCSKKEITITKHTFNSAIGAITKILFSLPLVPQLHSYRTSFLNFLIRYPLFDALSLLLSVSLLTQRSFEIDSCCYGSDYVTKPNSCQLNFFCSDYVSKRNFCQLNSLVLTESSNAIPVIYFFSLQPLLFGVVLVISSLLSVPTADVRYVLAFQQCYQAIPASKNTLVLAAWINFKVGTPTIHNTFPTSLRFDTHHSF